MPVQPRVTFYRMIDEARTPRRADKSADGTLPTRATRYCEAATSASSFGWWIYPPLDFWLMWDGAEIFWCYADQPEWMLLDSVQYPDFSRRFDAAAPDFARGCAPPFLTVLPEPGTLQIWTGLFARTRPDWSLLVRPTANLPAPGSFAAFEGIMETDQWFGPVLANIRLTRTHTPVRFRTDVPIAQVQPLPRDAYSDETLNTVAMTPNLEAWTAQDWADYDRDVVQPNSVGTHVPGRYAAAVRRRRKSACPHAVSAAMLSE